MSVGGMAIPDSAVEWINSNLKKGSTILEIGSGTGTEVLSRNYKMMSIEQDEEWVGKYDSDYLHAPIVDGWYDTEKVKNFLKDKTYDAILIDGPGEGGVRSKFFENIELFNTDVLLIFDDVERPDDMKNAKMVSEHIGRNLVDVLHAQKIYTEQEWSILNPMIQPRLVKKKGPKRTIMSVIFPKVK